MRSILRGRIVDLGDLLADPILHCLMPAEEVQGESKAAAGRLVAGEEDGQGVGAHGGVVEGGAGLGVACGQQEAEKVALRVTVPAPGDQIVHHLPQRSAQPFGPAVGWRRPPGGTGMGERPRRVACALSTESASRITGAAEPTSSPKRVWDRTWSA